MIRIKNYILLAFIGCSLASLNGYGQTDSLNANRYITKATLYGAGFTNVYDTYLSPQEYKGGEFRILRETMRMTKLWDGNISVQNMLQANLR